MANSCLSNREDTPRIYGSGQARYFPCKKQGNIASCVDFSEGQRGLMTLSSAEHSRHPPTVVFSTLLGPERTGCRVQHGDRVRLYYTGEPV